MLKIRNNRENYINMAEEKARDDSGKTESLEKEYDRKILEAGMRSSEIVSQNTSDANKKRTEVLAEKQNILQKEFETAEKHTEKQKEESIEILKPEIAVLAQKISSELLKEETVITNVTSETIEKAVRD